MDRWKKFFLGDPNLDVALFAGREVVLSPIDGVTPSLGVRFMCSKLYIDRLDIS